MSIESDIMGLNERFHKLVNMAKKQNNFNAYGWLMRYMQIEEDTKILESRFIEIISHVKRVEKELIDYEELKSSSVKDNDSFIKERSN